MLLAADLASLSSVIGRIIEGSSRALLDGVGMNIFLTGYRATGKSSVAGRIADQLGWAWLDTDDQIEQLAGSSIAEIFAQQGEAGFRELEHQVIQLSCQQDQQVLALGGGAIIAERNRELLQNKGPIIWLTAEAETILERLAADTSTRSRRPDLTAAGGIDEIRHLLSERTPVYRESASFTVATDSLTPAEVADLIIEWIQRQQASPDRGSES